MCKGLCWSSGGRRLLHWLLGHLLDKKDYQWSPGPAGVGVGVGVVLVEAGYVAKGGNVPFNEVGLC